MRLGSRKPFEAVIDYSNSRATTQQPKTNNSHLVQPFSDLHSYGYVISLDSKTCSLRGIPVCAYAVQYFPELIRSMRRIDNVTCVNLDTQSLLLDIRAV